MLPADGCLSLLAWELTTAPLNNHKYDTYRSCNVFGDVKAFRKQTARPVKLLMETLVEEETLGESKDIIKIYSCSFLQ
jgi:predicted ABC-type exoprotein transport system permease subunit